MTSLGKILTEDFSYGEVPVCVCLCVPVITEYDLSPYKDRQMEGTEGRCEKTEEQDSLCQPSRRRPPQSLEAEI